MRRVLRRAALVLLALLLPLTLAGCSEEAIAALKAAEEGEESAPYLALLGCDAVLEHCFVTKGKTTTPALVDDWEAAENDVVLVCGSIDNTSDVLVQVPYSDSDNPVYGYLDAACLSDTEPTTENANQVVLEDCRTYDAPDGDKLEKVSFSAAVLERRDGWYQVEPVSGKGGSCWVKAEDVSFFEAKR